MELAQGHAQWLVLVLAISDFQINVIVFVMDKAALGQVF
jgi:hypothetical protein